MNKWEQNRLSYNKKVREINNLLNSYRDAGYDVSHITRPTARTKRTTAEQIRELGRRYNANSLKGRMFKSYDISLNGKPSKIEINPIREKNIFQKGYSKGVFTLTPIERSIFAKMSAPFEMTNNIPKFTTSYTILEDLRYSSDAEPLGRKMFDFINNMMKNDKIADRINNWYLSQDGSEARQALDNATGLSWYKEFKDVFIIEFNRALTNIESNVEELQQETDEDFSNELNDIGELITNLSELGEELGFDIEAEELLAVATKIL